MRDVQRFGRYALYAVLLVLFLAVLRPDPKWTTVVVVALAIGAPTYWFWTLWVHRREHVDQPMASCSHCRVAFDLQRQEEERRTRQAEMERLHRRSRDH